MGMAGVAVIFLSHVRSSLVVVVGCAAIYSIIMLGQGRLKTVLALAFWMAICGVCSLLYAQSLAAVKAQWTGSPHYSRTIPLLYTRNPFVWVW